MSQTVIQFINRWKKSGGSEQAGHIRWLRLEDQAQGVAATATQATMKVESGNKGQIGDILNTLHRIGLIAA